MDPVSPWLDKGIMGLVVAMLLAGMGVLWARMLGLEKRISDVQDARLTDAKEQARQLYEATATLRAAMDLLKPGRP